MLYIFHSLPPLEPSETIEEKKTPKKLIFCVLIVFSVVIIILVSAIFVFPSTPDSVSITDVTVSFSSDICEIHFTIINSGDIDGFAIVEMYTYEGVRQSEMGNIVYEGRIQLDQNQYFMRANTTEEKYLQSEIIPEFYCNYAGVKVEILKFERD